ncbi:MAG: B12-binding domain-containing radical SAM protein [bacterium]
MQADSPRILLVNPWITDFAAYDFWLKPIGLLYLAAVLRAQGCAVRLVDCMDRGHPELMHWQALDRLQNRKWGTGKFVRLPIAKPAAYAHIPRHYARYGFPEEVLKKICLQGPAPDAILVTSGMTYWYPGVQQTIAVLRELFPKAPLLLGGIYATLCTEHARRHSGADWVLGGEADKSIDKIVAAVVSGNTVGSCDDSGVPHETVDLDQLPFPAFDLYPNLHYAAIMTSRGCPLKCTFCASRLVSGPYRWRSLANVMAELEWLHRGLGLREFVFYDDALLTNRDRHFKPLCQQIIMKDLNATFHTPNGLQVKFIDAETAQLMWRAGFKTIRLAYESGSADRQRDMSKKVSNETFAAGVCHLRAAGFGPVELDAYVMMALPGQPLAEVLWSMAYVHSLGVGIRLAAFSPIPGTVDYARALARGDLPADADPLLTNNSILPVRQDGIDHAVYELISRLAKQLNAHLQSTGRPMDSCVDLFGKLQQTINHFSP